MQRVANAAGIAREFRDVFELGGVPAFSRFYNEGIFVWKEVYRGFYRPWHVLPAPTVADPKAMRQMYRMNAAKAVCAELASLVWSEQCELRVNAAGWTEQKNEDGIVTNPDLLNAFVARVLRENAFSEKLQQLIEQGLALGGAAVKVWGDDPSGASRQLPLKGEPREDAEAKRGAVIRLGYAVADQFVPLAWDNARVIEGVFISRVARDRHYYTRLEWHRRVGGAYVVENQLFRSDMQNGANPGERQDILGMRVPLSELYPELEERTEVQTADSLFTYWRTPVANNLDDNSPLGMSLYGNAMETLHALDICYDSFVSEFRLGKKRIIVPARCVRQVTDPATGQLRRYFDPRDEVYEAFAGDDKDELKINDSSVELRVEEHIGALNAFLNVLCLQLGFSANTFSFDAQGGLKTATEVISENSKTFKTVKTLQNQLTPAIEHVVKNIIDVAVLYGATWEGAPVERLAAGGYEVKVTFDDGVTQDRQTNLNEGVMLVGAGLLSKFTFLTDKKYGQGLTEKEALAELERIRKESSANRDDNALNMFGE